LGAELECVDPLLADDVDVDDDVDDPAADDEDVVLWAAVLGAAPVLEVEFADDPPHAVNSRASEANPVATVHPLLRITLLT
jgi:hypothetical protein